MDNMPSLDSLFSGLGTQPPVSIPGSKEVIMVSHDMIDRHPHNHFKLYKGKKHSTLLESIRSMGVLTPVILQPQSNGRYYMLSGANRMSCNIEVGNTKIPATIRHGLSDIQAQMLILACNMQRGVESFLPSELAFSLKMQNNIIVEMRRQLQSEGKDSGEIVVEGTIFRIEPAKKTRQILADTYGIKSADVQRYIQLANLTDGLLELWDNKEINRSIALPLSHLPHDIQNEVLKFTDRYGASALHTPNAAHLKKRYEAETLELYDVEAILNRDFAKEIPKKRRTVTVKAEIITKYFPSQSDAEIQDILSAALDMYYKNKTA